MKYLISICFLSIFFFLPSQAQQRADWLVKPFSDTSSVLQIGRDLILDNGLVRRSFYISQNIACYDLLNYSNNQQLIRAVKPEAKIVLNGVPYEIGGLKGQSEMGYLMPGWLDQMHNADSSFKYIRYTVTSLEPLLPIHAMSWPGKLPGPKGKHLILYFKATVPSFNETSVEIHYQVYDGLPLIEKWLSITNNGNQDFRINQVVNEILGIVEEESAVVGAVDEMKKQHGIYVESNYAFNNAMRYDLSDQTLHWEPDSTYTSQVNYNFQTPAVLKTYPAFGPEIDLKAGEKFESIHSFELLMDSYDRQRRGLMIRKMYRTIAPWTIQNPIFMHLVSKNDDEVKSAIDQCVATGYEAVILSFGSHLNMEDESASNIRRWKQLADYAHKNGILLGGYSLFSSRHISAEDDVIDPRTGKPGAFFGNAPCFGSKWGLAYRDKIKSFFSRTGFDIWENDGPYPGDRCASRTHPGHRDADDSQWRQMEIQKELYHWLNAHNVYINAPDWYFLDGTHKIALGYREVNFSLSRDQQKILNRQNIYDGTQEKTASMSWGFVPLTKYQGGDSSAVLEPLHEHLFDYEQLMMQYYGAGVQACYRGPRLYDSEETKSLVKQVISWYKEHREILNADMIQLRRADGRDWDGWLHLNPEGDEKGLLMLFNPLSIDIKRRIRIPLYYSGLVKQAIFVNSNGIQQRVALDQNTEATLELIIPAKSYAWYIIK